MLLPELLKSDVVAFTITETEEGQVLDTTHSSYPLEVANERPGTSLGRTEDTHNMHTKKTTVVLTKQEKGIHLVSLGQPQHTSGNIVSMV